MLAVFGLGNPGRKYEGTRHNVGFEVIDRLAEESGVRVSQRRFRALIGEVTIEKEKDETEKNSSFILHPSSFEKLLLVKPQTYVNESGLSVRAAVQWRGLGPEEILVVCDDLDLDFGCIRIRRKGSSGGHKGLRSISAALGTTGFPRLRIGIGRPRPEEAVDYVLGKFTSAQRKAITRAVETAADAALCWATDGIERCMNKFN